MILDQYERPISSRSPQVELQRLRTQYNRIKARYDAAQTTEQNQLHWNQADYRGPNASANYHARRRLRSRSRYEVLENNSYLKGIALTLCNDFVGSGPKLRITDRRHTKERRKMIELAFQRWAKCIKLRQLLWRMRLAKMVDGETFAIEHTDPLIRSPVKMNYVLLEGDQVHNPNTLVDQKLSDNLWETDAIRYDKFGRPLQYFILDEHPGTTTYNAPWYKGQWYNARYVLHWYRKDRSWQRGVPETTPCLPLCSILRRYTLAVLQASEIAADFSGVLESTGPPNTNVWTTPEGQVTDDPFDTFPMDRGLFTTLPWGYTLKQMEAEQPTATYDAFVEAIVREIARCLCIPYNVASGFSGGYNFASGTLDRQLYQAALDTERLDCEDEVLNTMFYDWWYEASRIPDLFGQMADKEPPEFAWRWDRKPEHADPEKNANALATMWDLGFISDEQIQQEHYNRDPEEHYDALSRQRDSRKALELPLPSHTEVTMDTQSPQGNPEGDDAD